MLILGKVLNNGKRYHSWREYVEAIAITVGVFTFSLATKGWNNHNYYDDGNRLMIHTIWGYLLLIAYSICDAFTSQWQEKIYLTYGRRNVDAFQMMFGVNLFGVAVTTLGILFSGDVTTVVEFLRVNPVAIKYLLITAWTSCLGQICIFFMLREFGPVVLTILLTIRQMVSIFLSAIAFHHHDMSIGAVFGVVVVFLTIAYQIRRNYILARQPDILQT